MYVIMVYRENLLTQSWLGLQGLEALLEYLG